MCCDMKHFKELTTGSVVIMGRRTIDSIGAALPNRQSIVLTRNGHCQISGVTNARTLDEAYSLAKGYDEVYIAGGGEIYNLTINDADRIYATEVDANISGADTFFPGVDDGWEITSEQKFPADEKNIYPYRFVTYEKK